MAGYSIFVGPQYIGEDADNPRELEEKLNGALLSLWDEYGLAAAAFQPLRLTVSSGNGTIDVPAVTQRRLNDNLRLLADAAGTPAPYVTLDPSRQSTAGFTPSLADALTSYMTQQSGGGLAAGRAWVTSGGVQITSGGVRVSVLL